MFPCSKDSAQLEEWYDPPFAVPSLEAKQFCCAAKIKYSTDRDTHRVQRIWELNSRTMRRIEQLSSTAQSTTYIPRACCARLRWHDQSSYTLGIIAGFRLKFFTTQIQRGALTQGLRLRAKASKMYRIIAHGRVPNVHLFRSDRPI